MDKVIIDGVDVSGCEFIGDIKNNFVKCTSWVHNSKKQVSGHWDCRENKACYYKELKRLQAEYDDLHLTYAGCKTANTGLQELNDKLQAENEKLKTDIGIYKVIIDSDKEENERITEENNSFMNGEYCANGCKKMNNAFLDVHKCLIQENERLKEENKKLKYYLNKIREDELNSIDVEWDEYITECTSTEYTNVITFVELALGERDE